MEGNNFNQQNQLQNQINNVVQNVGQNLNNNNNNNNNNFNLQNPLNIITSTSEQTNNNNNDNINNNNINLGVRKRYFEEYRFAYDEELIDAAKRYGLEDVGQETKNNLKIFSDRDIVAFYRVLKDRASQLHREYREFTLNECRKFGRNFEESLDNLWKTYKEKKLKYIRQSDYKILKSYLSSYETKVLSYCFKEAREKWRGFNFTPLQTDLNVAARFADPEHSQTSTMESVIGKYGLYNAFKNYERLKEDFEQIKHDFKKISELVHSWGFFVDDFKY